MSVGHAIIEIQQRKVTLMNVTVTNPNGESIYPVYEPSHKLSLVKFYTEYVIENVGAKVLIKDDLGNVVLDI